MDTKLLWVSLPLVGYAGLVVLQGLRGRWSRHLINIHVSLLLLAYLSVTAGLGIFWVANQQLPVFDWHYLFGYGTVLLVLVHLAFNLRVVVKALTKQSRARTAFDKRGLSRWLAIAAAFTLVVLASFGLGMRHGKQEFALSATDQAGQSADAGWAIIEQYHEVSSASRRSMFARAPAADWGGQPEAFKQIDAKGWLTIGRGDAARLASRSLSVAIERPAQIREGISSAELGAILFHTVGITEERAGIALRASPSSGGLFPTEVYVAIHAVDGIEPGVYHYDARDERLQRLPKSWPAEWSPAGASATVVLTSVFRRTGHKYRDRAYRYALVDAGHALENFRLAASEAGLGAHPLPSFPDAELAQVLGIDIAEEGVIALVPLTPDAGPVGSGLNWPSEPFIPTTVRQTGSPRLGMTGLAHAATSLTRAQQATFSELHLLEGMSYAPGSVLEVIRRRRSQRRFSAEPVGLNLISSILFDMTRAAPQLSNAVRIDLIVNRVSGLEPAVYRYQPAQRSLALKRAGDFSEPAEAAALSQEVVGRAGAVFVLSVDRTTLRQSGARGYRHALLEVGMLGERLVLSAVARGLGACPVGAFYDDEAAALVSVHPEREWVTHFAAVGKL